MMPDGSDRSGAATFDGIRYLEQRGFDHTMPIGADPASRFIRDHGQRDVMVTGPLVPPPAVRAWGGRCTRYR